MAGLSGLTAASRATGFARVLVVTAVLGTTFLGNTYQVTNTVPNIVVELFAAGALHAVLVPTIVGVLDRDGRERAEAVAGGVLGAVMLGLGAVALVGMVASPFIMRLLASGVDDPAVRAAQIQLGTVFLLVFLPQVVLYGVGLVSTALLHAHHRFNAPAIAPMASNLVVIVAYGVFWWLYRDPAAWPAEALTPVEIGVLAGGTTLGVVALTAVPVIALARHGTRLRPRWRPRDPEVRRLGRHGGWAVGQVVATQLLLVVVLVMANATEGGVVAFQFALTFFLLPFALVALPVATAVFPTLSRLAGAPERFAAVTGRALVAVATLLLFASAALTALAWPLVRVAAFGQATAAGSGTLVHALMALAPGLVGYGVLLVLTRASYARGDARTPSLTTLAVLGVGAMAMVALAGPLDGGARVTVLAGIHSVAYLVAAAALWWRFDRRLAGLHLKVGSTFVALVGAATVAGVAMAAVVALVPVSGRVGSLLVAAAAAVVGGGVYLCVVRLCGRSARELVRLDPAAGG